ncbi:MAG: DNA translocase FtsK 4TM domain-containing protein [Christensenellales bacterium]
MAQAKKTGGKGRPAAKKNTQKRRAAPKKPAKASRGYAAEFTGLGIIVLALLSLLGIFGSASLSGVVGQTLQRIFFGCFGMLAYAVPVVLLALGLVIIIAPHKHLNGWKIAMICVLLLVSIAISHLFVTVPILESTQGYQGFIQGSYELGLSAHRGAGGLGGVMIFPLQSLFGLAGTYVVLCAFFLAAFVMLFNLSLRRAARQVGASINQSLQAAHEASTRRQEERRKPKLYVDDLKEEDWEQVQTRTQDDDPLVLGSGVRRKGERANTKSASRLSEAIDQILEDGPRDIGAAESSAPAEEETPAPNEPEQTPAFTIEQEPEIAVEQTPPWDEGDDAGAYETVYDPKMGMRGQEQPPDGAPSEGDPATEAAPASAVASPEAAPTVEPAPEPTPPPYVFPDINLLKEPSARKGRSNGDIQQQAKLLEDVLASFSIKAKVLNVSCGPVITRYEVQPAPGVKVSRIVGLADDIALNMAAAGVRIEAPIPGKAAIGVEIPNADVATVTLREGIDTDAFRGASSPLTVALGKDIAGKVVLADLSRMPHLLIAGATGSGKSVCINSLIVSLLYRSTPEDVRLIMIDPKVVELSVYNGIPHLLVPVVTDPKKAAGALNWAIKEMEDRYQRFYQKNVRNLAHYNEVAFLEGEAKLPQIVVIVDELADLMMTAAKDVEDAICRLAQKARAAGIYLVIATQRPSVDVITGLIKANIPSRIAFAVSSQTDSRTILDMGGAEKLLGRGDMLYYPNGMSKPLRVQGGFVSDDEVENIVAFMKEHNASGGDNRQEILEKIESLSVKGGDGDDGEDSEGDALLPQALGVLLDTGQASITMIQRRLRVGYARAARLIDEMWQKGYVSGPDGSKPRQLLITREQYNELFGENDLSIYKD